MNEAKEWGQNYAVAHVLQYKQARIVYPPGFGKSRIAAMIILAISQLRGVRIRALIVTDSVNSRDVTWPVELDIWGCETLRIGGQIKICRYEQLQNFIGEYDIIICDEAHSFTDPSSQACFRCKSEYLVFMTATEPDKDDKPRMMSFFNHIIPVKNRIVITIDDAIKMGALNNYLIRLFEYDIEGEEYDRYLDICKSVQGAQNRQNTKLAEIYRIARMDIVYNFESKIRVTNYVQRRIKNQRRLIFTMRKAAAEKLSRNVYHSGTTDHCLRAFEEEAIIDLATVKALRYGANFPNLRYIICSQIDSKKRNFVQEAGRGFRLQPHDTVELWITVAKNTVDADWTRKAIKDFDPSRIYREHINLAST